MSRETVAWTASIPIARSASATSACVESGCCCTRRRIVPCRSNFVVTRAPPSGVGCRAPLRRAQRQRRRQAERVLAGAADHETVLERGLDERARPGRSSSTASSSPSPRTAPNGARPGASCAETLAHVREQRVVDRVDDGAGGGAGDGVAAEGRRVVAGRKAGRCIVGDEQRADRQPIGEPLRERDGVRPNAVGLPGEERAAPPDARSAPRRGSGARRARRRARAPRASVSGSSGCTPPSPCTGSSRIAAVSGPTCSASVVGSREACAGNERLERRPLRRLARDRERAERAPVEGALERHDLGCAPSPCAPTSAPLRPTRRPSCRRTPAPRRTGPRALDASSLIGSVQ